VYVSPTQLTVGTPIGVQRDPAGVAIYENAQDPTRNRTYVINQYDKSVSVIDGNPSSTTYNKVVATIKLASTPSDIVVNSTGTRAYVAMKGNATVTVIDTVANKVLDVNSTTTTVDSIKVGSTPAGIAISPDDSRVYVTNGGSSTVSVIDTALNKEISRITVGSQPNGVAVSPDGKKLYVTLRYSDSLAVVDLATPTAAPALIKVGDSPREVVLTPVTGARAYVTNYDGTVSVIDTATKTQLTKITTGGPKLQPAGVAIDGTRGLVYVANGKDTVSVIDARTNAIVGTITIDSVAESGAHYVALSADGTRIYVTDFNDDNLRVLSLTRANTAPLATAEPTKGDVNPYTGTVMGLVNISDPDGDALTFTTVSGATKGTVTYNAAAGTYAYTPSQAARDQAAQNPGLTDTFTIRATDPSGVYKDTAAITVTILPSVISAQPSGTSPRSANPLSGEVRGPVVVSGGGLSYTVIGAPAKGAVTINSQGEYVYTPTLAARLAADLTTGPDTDSFTVRVTGPQTSQIVAVTVPVSPARVTVDSQFAPSLGTAPAGVDMNYRRAWIVNQADGTMSIIEVPHGYTVATLPVGTSPTSVAWNFDYAWVTNQGANTVSVIDLVYNPGATQTLSGFNQPTDVLLDYPGIVFVSNKGNNTVVAIHPQTKQVLHTFQVGQAPTEMALTGVHLYVANSGGNSVSMIDLETNTVSAPIPVGVNPTGLAISPDGKWVYVTNKGSNTVSVINAATNTVVGSPIGVGSQPTSVVISPDSSLAYVANSDDTVSVIDTRTHTVVRTVSIDPNPEIGSHAMSLSQASNYPYRDDDRIYVTDAADRTMRALAITPSPAPQLPAITTPITTGIGPGSVAIVGDYAYVVNAGGTVSKVDTTTNTVVGDPIPVSGIPMAVAASGDRLYVTTTDYYYFNEVSVIDINTNTVVDTVPVPLPNEYCEWVCNYVSDVEASPDGSRLYVSATDGYIRAIDTASKSVVGAVYAGSDMDVSADGNLLYVTGGDAIAVYDTTSLAKVGEIHVGPYQYDSSRQMTISADGTRAYVTTSVVVVEAVDSYHTDQEVIRDNNDNLWRVHGRYDAVSVIDISDPASPTYNTEIASIPVVGGAGDVAVSSDGSRAYVTAADGKTVTVVDLNTKTVIGAVTTGQNPYGYQQVAVGANGTVYLTNGYDSSVYAVAVGNPQV
jgi:YVTN family beta-propeller protein/VCBS repeat-containing protein